MEVPGTGTLIAVVSTVPVKVTIGFYDRAPFKGTLAFEVDIAIVTFLIALLAKCPRTSKQYRKTSNGQRFSEFCV